LLLVCYVSLNEKIGNDTVDSELNKFVGQWWPYDGTIIESMYCFYSNGTFSSTFGSQLIYGDSWSYGTYEVKDRKIFLSYDNTNETIIWNYSFSNNNTILTFSYLDYPETYWSYKK